MDPVPSIKIETDMDVEPATDAVPARPFSGLDLDIPDIELSCNSLNHFVPVGKKRCSNQTIKKQILTDVNATFRSGELCALMGPSGAGKTSLLGVLSAGVNSGLRLNGKPLPKNFRLLCCTIPQYDILFPAFTAKQTLMYSARLRLPEKLPKTKVEAIVDKLIADLQLVKCKDTPIGNESIRGVSGGERKRVSIGMELVTNPSILFVDEPTSGLDSKMAEDSIQLLKNLSKETRRLVICTIHQPSWSLFTKFDKLLLLHQGRVVYQGETGTRLQSYFSSIGFKPPSFENPLDFYMRELQLQDAKDPTFFADQWEKLDADTKAGYDHESRGDYSNEITAAQMKDLTKSNSFLHQFQILFRRTVHDTVMDKRKFVQGMIMKTMIGLLLGVIFIGQANAANPMNSLSPLFFLVLRAAMDTMMRTVMEFPLTRPLIVREYKNGAYNFEPYFLSHILSSNVFDLIGSLCYLPAYFLIGFGARADQVFIFLAGVALLTVAGSAIGVTIGSFAKDMKDAQGYIMPVLMPLMIFSGFLIPFDDIPAVFKFLYWASPFQYCLSALTINQFRFREPIDGGPNGMAILTSMGFELSEMSRNILILLAIDGFLLICAYFIVRRSILKQSRIS